MTDKTSICLVSINSYPLFNRQSNVTFGGAELQVYLLAKHLAKDDRYCVSVIVGDFGQEKIELQENVKLVKAHSKNQGKIAKFLAPFKLYKAIKSVKPLVLIQRAAGPETGICGFYAQLNNIKFIYSVAHDAETIGQSVASHNLLYSRLYNYGLIRTDKIVVQSNAQLQALSELNKKLSAKASVIKNSIELALLPRNDKKKSILWIARAKDWKRPGIFIQLANAFPEETFTMVMPISESSDEMISVKKIAMNTPNIIFKSNIGFDSSQDLFIHSKLFINTSSWEGFPNTFLQAGIASTPIVSLKVDPDNFIKNNECGFVCLDSFTVLVDKVNFLLTDEDAWEKSSLNCFRYVKKYHDIETNIKNWKVLISAEMSC